MHWGKFFHPDDAVLKTFGGDVFALKQLIAQTSSDKFKNCWTERLLFGNANCPFDSNFDEYAARLEHEREQEQLKKKK